MRNRTANENVTIQSKTVLGKAAPTTFVFRPIQVDQTDKPSVSFAERVNIITIVDLSDTSTEISSFTQNFLSSTEMSEEDLTENEKRANTDPQFLKPIPGPDISAVLSS